MQPKRIFVVGSLNIDLVTEVQRLPGPGETLAGSDLLLVPGGKGANQVCAAARLGAPARMLGQLGDDAFAGALLASLQAAGVNTDGVGTSPGATGAACISVLPGGENAIVISPGANARLTPQLALSHLDDLESGDLVLLQLETPIDTVEAVVTHAAVRRAITILDPAPARDLPSSLLRQVTFLTPNESEAALLLKRPVATLRSFDEASEAAMRLRELGPAGVILKLGSLGCYLSGDGIATGVPGFEVEAVDTTAAGDTFNGAFAVGLADGMPLPVAARFANAAAALSVTRVGAQSSIPSRAEVSAFLKAHDPQIVEMAKELNQVCSS